MQERHVNCCQSQLDWKPTSPRVSWRYAKFYCCSICRTQMQIYVVFGLSTPFFAELFFRLPFFYFRSFYVLGYGFTKTNKLKVRSDIAMYDRKNSIVKTSKIHELLRGSKRGANFEWLAYNVHSCTYRAIRKYG